MRRSSGKGYDDEIELVLLRNYSDHLMSIMLWITVLTDVIYIPSQRHFLAILDLKEQLHVVNETSFAGGRILVIQNHCTCVM